MDAAAAQAPVPASGPSCPGDFTSAIAYIKEVVARTPKETSKQLLDVLRSFREDDLSVTYVHTQAESLLGAYPDLLKRFKEFLPPSAEKEEDGKGKEEVAEMITEEERP